MSSRVHSNDKSTETAMSFSFGFSSNDFSDDELAESTSVAALGDASANGAANGQLGSALDDVQLVDDISIVQPAQHSLESLLRGLQGVRLSFETVASPETGTVLYRRELFDIKHQLMSSEGDKELDIIVNEDLKRNVYEGGLKSWECSLDLVDLLSARRTDLAAVSKVIEIGCGTALPTEYVFREYLLSNRKNGLTLVLTDYNFTVLQLASLPNMILTWAKETLDRDQWAMLQRSEDPTVPVMDNELLLTADLLQRFRESLAERHVTLDFVSGSWGRKFTDIVHSLLPQCEGTTAASLVLTSETIYQPENLPLITETLLDLKGYIGGPTTVLVAAKDIYFGVGGSVLDFEKRLDGLNVQYNTTKIQSGLKRSIVTI
ncbi:protein-histidine N-methyltransferase KNAG_0E01900 [Huiozyma naganishii CBS 8797]|uniref:protein-histidine N-methyltransferase n=1 Tax=Huiozyma naganishii (strain ATCC MYA-139 / BCRC 22969 / CBS 8797 / KCTC 17520 / NBRC 10181 / NCYC 3082 / Yp74L-3) TaxID=1071383 RepID=J7RZ27_HUIN7|nr:hypothetical protein KNAG_0E01900 [Kazachstania naganishii CBS 8797]CCK70452.1 hypothetical protein KNAG_0E01900 [Kazachstania naganishii CBS 8797]